MHMCSQMCVQVSKVQSACGSSTETLVPVRNGIRLTHAYYVSMGDWITLMNPVLMSVGDRCSYPENDSSVGLSLVYYEDQQILSVVRTSVELEPVEEIKIIEHRVFLSFSF